MAKIGIDVVDWRMKTRVENQVNSLFSISVPTENRDEIMYPKSAYHDLKCSQDVCVMSYKSIIHRK